jgi:hypothetical protein
MDVDLSTGSLEAVSVISLCKLQIGLDHCALLVKEIKRTCKMPKLEPRRENSGFGKFHTYVNRPKPIFQNGSLKLSWSYILIYGFCKGLLFIR